MTATRRHRFLLSALYEVPVGKNRKYFAGMNRIADTAIGGWSLSTVSLWRLVPYLTPITSKQFDPGNLNLSYRGSFQRPDCIGNGNIANPATGSMFNLAAFNPVPSGPVGKLWRRDSPGPWHNHHRCRAGEELPDYGTASTAI